MYYCFTQPLSQFDGNNYYSSIIIYYTHVFRGGGVLPRIRCLYFLYITNFRQISSFMNFHYFDNMDKKQ